MGKAKRRLASAGKPTLSSTTGSGGDRLRVGDPAAGDQPLRRLGQEADRQRQEHHDRKGADPEESAPADAVAERDRGQGGEDAAGRDTGVDDRVVAVALAGRGELGDEGADGGDQGADADAGEEAEEAEGRDRLRRGGDGHADGEPRQVDQHHLASSDAVTDRAGCQGADQHADQGIAAERPGLGRCDRPEVGGVGQQDRHDGAVDDEVVAVEDEGRGGEEDDPGDAATATRVLLRGRHSGCFGHEGAPRGEVVVVRADGDVSPGHRRPREGPCR